MKKLFFACIAIACLAMGHTVPVYAEGVRIAPLEYKTELKKGERKEGHVDISNPSNETVDVKLYVQAFSQVDNQGNLTFFDSEQIQKGILLDFETATIGPRQTLRLFFIADGTKLPSGDVFGVIFAETKSAGHPGTNTTARVGTLVMLINGTPGPRHTEISDMNVSPIQIGNQLSGIVAVKNPAPKGSATGFFPDVKVELAPWGGQTEFEGPLIFAGNTRTFGFDMPSNQFGIYLVKVTANDAERTAVVFLVTGWWRFIVPSIIILIVGTVLLVRKYKPHKKVRFRHR